MPQLAAVALAVAVTASGGAFAVAQTSDRPTRSVNAADSVAAPPAGVDGAMRKALDALPKSDGRYTVAVEDLNGQAAAVYGGTGAYDTASIVKVDILATLLLDAQDNGAPSPRSSRSWPPR